MVRILLVEDDPDVRPLLEDIFLGEHYEVVTSETVATVSHFSTRSPSIWSSATSIYPMAVASRSPTKRLLPATKTLVVTGHGLSLKPGGLAAYDYLLKPLPVAELIGAVERCLAEEDGNGEIVPFPKSPS